MMRDETSDGVRAPAHHYAVPQKVLFRHCDPAGIVFYPRFFEMLNDAVEAMFRDLLDWPFEEMHPEHGVPTAALDVNFRKPCRHGETLNFRLTINSAGRSSLTLTTRTTGGEEGDLRFEVKHTLVCIGSNGRAMPWPEDVKRRMMECLGSGQ